MTCVEYRRWLTPYVDEQLASQERAQLEGHLQSCVGCREELHAHTRMIASLREMEPVAAPDLLPGIHRRLAQEPWWRVAVQRFTAPWPASLPVHGLALAACSALVLMITLLPQARSGKEKARQGMLEMAAAPQERFRGLAEEGKSQLLGIEDEDLHVRDQAGQLKAGRADRQLTPSSPVVFYGMRSTIEQVDAKKVNESARTAVVDQMVTMKKTEMGAGAGIASREFSEPAGKNAPMIVPSSSGLPRFMVTPEDQVCQRDVDCVLMRLACDPCECEEAINNESAARYREHPEALQCPSVRQWVCGTICPESGARCVDQRCTRVPIE